MPSPQDLGTVRAQLDAGVYGASGGGFAACLADCRRVFANARHYNADHPASDVAQAAAAMQADLEAAVQELGALPPGDALVPRLETVLRLPPALNATHNGTALQLQLQPPPSARAWGATVWLGAASIVEVKAEPQ